MEDDATLKSRAADARRWAWAGLGLLVVSLLLILLPFILGAAVCTTTPAGGRRCELQSGSSWVDVAEAGFLLLIASLIAILALGSREARVMGELQRRGREREPIADRSQEPLHPRNFDGPFQWTEGHPLRWLLWRVYLRAVPLACLTMAGSLALLWYVGGESFQRFQQTLFPWGPWWIFPILAILVLLGTPLGMWWLIEPWRVGLSPGGIRVVYRGWKTDIGWDEILWVRCNPESLVCTVRVVLRPGRKRQIDRSFFATEAQAKAILRYPSGRTLEAPVELRSPAMVHPT